jgi:hypothetical protein
MMLDLEELAAKLLETARKLPRNGSSRPSQGDRAIAGADSRSASPHFAAPG